MSEVLLAMLAGGFGLLSGVLAVLLKAETERRHDLARQVFENKRSVYGQFSDFVNTIISSPTVRRDPKAPEVQQLVGNLTNIQKEIWSYGSPEVVLAFSAFRQASFDPPDNNQVALMLVVRLVLTMRLDMGLSNVGLDELDILRLFVNDADKVYPQAAKDTAAYLRRIQSTDRPSIS